MSDYGNSLPLFQMRLNIYINKKFIEYAIFSLMEGVIVYFTAPADSRKAVVGKRTVSFEYYQVMYFLAEEFS